jgi:acyl-CoA synthetase (AMP-forming)/AMP-acid ligase II
MKGYLKNEQETKRTLKDGGWLHTGDLAYYDSDNYFFVVGRLKELINVNCSEVAPAELEDILREHPKIADVGIIGIPDAKKGHVPFAFVVKKRGLEDDLQEIEIHDFLRDKVADYKYLAGGVRFMNALLYSPAGKILRKDLLELYNNERVQNS